MPACSRPVHRVALGLAVLLVVSEPVLAQPAPDPCSGEPAAPAAAPPPPAPTAEPRAIEPAPVAPAPVTEAASAPSSAPPSDGPPVAPSATIDGFKVAFGGYVQPQVWFRQNDLVVQNDEDGFSVRRARLLARGTGKAGSVDVGMYFEADTTPQFVLLDAYAWAKQGLPRDGQVSLYAGQMFAPFSRQTMLSDSARSFVEKPDLTSIAPDRQIGTKAMVRVPGAPWAQLWGGVFDGEG